MNKEGKFLIDINDPENWLRVNYDQHPGQPVNEEQRQILWPEGPNQAFEFTDSVFYGGSTYHEHAFGWETFFLTAGRMDLTCHGKICTCEAGDILLIQPYCAHQMQFLEQGHWRGTFHDINMASIQNNWDRMRQYDSDCLDDEVIKGTYMANRYNILREPALPTRVDKSEMWEVRNKNKYLTKYEFEGVTLKQMTARWENNGVTEMWRAEMQDGFGVQYERVLPNQDLFYVESGSVEFTVAGETFTADQDCLVKIPCFVPRSFVSRGESVMYDIGGTTHWLDVIEDYLSIRHYQPEKLKDETYMHTVLRRHECYVKQFGLL